MQTFLPFKSFSESAKHLDRSRLGKQRVECKQILNILLGENENSRWKNHPAVRMWIGYEEALKLYTNIMIEEWKSRGYNNTMELYEIGDTVIFPEWLGNERLHKSHRIRLMQKDKNYYSKFDWEDIPEAPYWWPVPLKNKKMQKEIEKYWEGGI